MVTLTKRLIGNNPRGLMSKALKTKVYKLVKSLYGLKQALKQWYKKIDKIMLANEFIINKVDKYVYIKNIDKCYVIIGFYMDEMSILDNNDYMIKSTEKILTDKFDMKDLGAANVILRIKISRIFDGLVLF